MAGRNPMFNSSGCKDLTAYHAIGNVIKEEKELDKRVHNLINVLKFIIDWAGFYSVVCNYLNGGCGACGGYRETKDEAIIAWNKRESEVEESEVRNRN